MLRWAAVLLTAPDLVAPAFTGLYMEKMVGFLKLYFPAFVLGALFGKVIELSGFSQSIAAAVIRLVGPTRTIPADRRRLCATDLWRRVVVRGGVRRLSVRRRLVPTGRDSQAADSRHHCFGSVHVHDGLPSRLAADPEHHPDRLFQDQSLRRAAAGNYRRLFILTTGLLYLNWRRRCAALAGEGYGKNPLNEPQPLTAENLTHPLVAMLPLLLMWGTNKAFAMIIPIAYGDSHSFHPAAIGNAAAVVQDVSKLAAIWAVEGALLVGILAVFALAWKTVAHRFNEGSKPALAGALLASANTASEYGFGAVIASLPGFRVIAEALTAVPDPLVNEAVTVTTLAAITGSASGGMSIALAALSETFIRNAQAAGIPMELLHRVAAMASGGMDTLPHNGAVITLLTVTGLTHRQAYQDIFAVTIIKTLAVFVVIAVYRLTGIV